MGIFGISMNCCGYDRRNEQINEADLSRESQVKKKNQQDQPSPDVGHNENAGQNPTSTDTQAGTGEAKCDADPVSRTVDDVEGDTSELDQTIKSDGIELPDVDPLKAHENPDHKGIVDPDSGRTADHTPLKIHVPSNDLRRGSSTEVGSRSAPDLNESMASLSIEHDLRALGRDDNVRQRNQHPVQPNIDQSTESVQKTDQKAIVAPDNDGTPNSNLSKITNPLNTGMLRGSWRRLSMTLSDSSRQDSLAEVERNGLVRDNDVKQNNRHLVKLNTDQSAKSDQKTNQKGITIPDRDGKPDPGLPKITDPKNTSKWGVSSSQFSITSTNSSTRNPLVGVYRNALVSGENAHYSNNFSNLLCTLQGMKVDRDPYVSSGQVTRQEFNPFTAGQYRSIYGEWAVANVISIAITAAKIGEAQEVDSNDNPIPDAVDDPEADDELSKFVGWNNDDDNRLTQQIFEACRSRKEPQVIYRLLRSTNPSSLITRIEGNLSDFVDNVPPELRHPKALTLLNAVSYRGEPSMLDLLRPQILTLHSVAISNASDDVEPYGPLHWVHASILWNFCLDQPFLEIFRLMGVGKRNRKTIGAEFDENSTKRKPLDPCDEQVGKQVAQLLAGALHGLHDAELYGHPIASDPVFEGLARERLLSAFDFFLKTFVPTDHVLLSWDRQVENIFKGIRASGHARANLEALFISLKEIEAVDHVRVKGEGALARMELKTLPRDSLTFKILEKLMRHRASLQKKVW